MVLRCSPVASARSRTVQFKAALAISYLGNSKIRDRRSFIGGPDARMIMGNDETNLIRAASFHHIDIFLF